MHIPYPRPATLSDPYCDWDGCEEEIARTIAADPASLLREHYEMIFQTHLPAANYEEGCFYVPHFLDFFERTPPFTSPGLESFFWFVEHFREDFARDSLLQPVLDRLWEIFLKLTASFSVHRLSDEDLKSMTICESCREMVPGSRAVHELLDCFTGWPVFDPLIEKVKGHFDRADDVKRSFWFAECAYHTRQWLWLSNAPAGGPQRLTDALQEVFARRQLLFDFFHRIDRFGAHYRNSKLSLRNTTTMGFFQYNQRISPT